MTTYTTLKAIRNYTPCGPGWEKLLAYLGKTEADDAPLALTTILDSNGLDDAIWALRAVDDVRKVRLFAVACARQVQHLMQDQRSLKALDVAERFANGEATEKELRVAWAAAWAAARAAAGDAAGDAAWAARAAAWDATGDAARAARAAARAKQAQLFREIFE